VMESSKNIEPKINASQAAKLNGVSAKTMIRWAQAGMPHFHFEKKYLFYQSEVELWMEQNFRSGTVPNMLRFPAEVNSAR
jgi:predicted site-specific integrase-resolvase